jgi:phospholipid/cholesterol/gamma-HCH transport system permease protein
MPATEAATQHRGRILIPAARLGKGVRLPLERIGSAAWLMAQVIRSLFRLRREQFQVLRRVLRLQVKFTALEALPLTMIAALLMGGITLIQVFGQLSTYGAEDYLSQLLAKLVIRELGPLLVGVIVIGRSGTAIAAEMASMKLSGEVDALIATGVNPIQYLLVPRMLGGIVAVFSLIIFFDATALLGGFIVAWWRLPLSLTSFMDALGGVIGAKELAITFLKALVFGGSIPLLCASYGLRVKRSTTEIPQAVTKAAVASLLMVFLIGGLLSAALYG